MHNDDTPGRALGLLDRAVLMRLDPAPLVAITTDSLNDEPVLVGALGLDADLYVDILSALEQAASTMGLLGWGRKCDSPTGDCWIPHRDFGQFQVMLDTASESRKDGRVSEAAAQLDQLLDGDVFGVVHRSLAGRVRSVSPAVCVAMQAPKPEH